MTDTAPDGTGDSPGATPAPPAASRAGRNLTAAIAVGVGLGALVLVSLFTFKWLFVAVAVVALGVGVQEIATACAQRGIRVQTLPLYAGLVAVGVTVSLWGTTALLATVGTLVVVLLMWRLPRGVAGYVRDVSASVLVAAYLPLMLGFVVLLLRADDGPQRIVAFILLTICSDIGGYAVGVLVGRHPIAPAISPKKSWEGLVGSFAFQAVAGALLFAYLFDAPWWQGVLVGLAMTVVATGGDFVESALKRDLGVKDFGSILPGHGGLMDRLDSLVPNAFAAWALFTWFLGG